MSDKLKSRKLWMGLITALVIFLNDLFEFGLDEATITALVTTAVGYVLGQGVVDAANAYSSNRAIGEVEATRLAVGAGPINPE